MNFVTVFLSAWLLFVSNVAAETREYWWKPEWITANPDGMYERKVISCNGTYPWPDIRVKTGDRIVIHLINGLPDQNTSVHFHGLFQEGTNEFDGVPMLTQCEIPPNETMVYNFTVDDQVGSYWYHSHSGGQYMDGMRGCLIIEEKDDDDYPFDFDEDVIIRLTEWYHEMTDDLKASFMNLYNPTGAEPIPEVVLMNDTFNGTLDVEPGKTYLFRIINTGGFLSQYVWFEDHTMEIVAIDGVYVEPNVTDYIYLTVAQRYDVLVTTKNDTSRNYALMIEMDQDLLDTVSDAWYVNSTCQMRYNSSAPNATEDYSDDLYDVFTDDFYLTPLKKRELYEDYDYQIIIDVIMDNLNDGINYAFFNNITYVAAKVPTLGTVLSAGNESTTDVIYGTNTHSFVLAKDEVVEIVLNNQDTGKHPFHLHGHLFQAIERGPDYTDAAEPIGYNETAPYDPPSYPMVRDTMYVRPQSYFRIRFKASNPGVWFYHCHIEWHLIQGLAITLIEDPVSIQEKQSVTENWKQICEAAGTPYEGNAAANTEDLLDITGQNVQVKTLPSGMTARGIVALVFSCISAFIGMFAICWYGMADIPNLQEDVFEDLDVNKDKEETTAEGSSSSDNEKAETDAAATELKAAAEETKETAN